jgi:hypothetical protein
MLSHIRLVINLGKIIMLKRHFSVVLLCLLASACQSTNSEHSSTPQNSVQITQQELDSLKESAAQWQQAKPSIDRLIAIENDLNLLITQLNDLAKSQTENQAKSSPVSEQVVESVDVKSNAYTEQPLFALQVASVTETARLTRSLEELKSKAPSMFTGQFAVNVEAVEVNNVVYHRLKIGAYKEKQMAEKDCQLLKQKEVNCLVTQYTNKPFSGM